MVIAIIILGIACLGAVILYDKQLKIQSVKEKEYSTREAQLAALEGELSAAKIDLSRKEQQLAEANEAIRRQSERAVKAEENARMLAQRIDEERGNRKEELESMERRQKELMEQYEAKFKVMANEILQSHGDSLRQQNEVRLGEILNPLKENIDRFRNEVSQAYSNEARERFSLQEKIKELVELNNSIGREAKELANALKGNSKKQGDWGELVLESILEKSGLREGEEFVVQLTTDESGATLRDEHGRGLRPDVVVNYPGGKAMVIDSKVSLTAFIDYVNCETPEKQAHYGKLHLASVEKHINELSEKRYQDYVGIERLDFVMMFIPNEAAYAAAMTLDPSLWQKAYDKHVLVVSPTQLVGSLRLIKQLWNNDRQSRNALDIATKAGGMYDKFVGFVADMDKIEKGLIATNGAYKEAMKKLKDGSGNLVKRAEDLRKLGIKHTKLLPDAMTKMIDQSEE